MGSEVAWEQTVAAALLGTERQPFQPPTTTGALADVLNQLGTHSSESALLTTAATLALHRRIGWIPETRSLPVPVAPPDDRSPCSPQATRLLQRLLQGEHPELLPEWLELAAIAHHHLPAAYLPELLERGRQQPQLRPGILGVLGQRGQWLAAQNPDWSYAVTLATESDWETGSLAARLTYLQEVRSQNPDRARELVQSTWKQESAGDRAKFLEVFQTNLSLADEPFLETALDDRGKEVRRVAATLLTQLPDSQLSQRLGDRVQTLITVQHQADGLVLEVSLPETCDKAMQRDGIQVKASDPTGERAWWLQQLITAAPLSRWGDPEQIPALLAAAQESDWSDLLLKSWQQATRQQRNSAWARALLYHRLRDRWDQTLQQLLGLLPAEQQVEYGLHAIQYHRQYGHESFLYYVLTVLLALSTYPAAWSQALAEFSLTTLIELLPTLRDSSYYTLKQLLHVLPSRISPDLLPTAVALLPAAEQSPASARGYSVIQDVETFFRALEFRRQIQQAF